MPICWIKSLFFVLFLYKKYSRRFITLRLNHWWQMEHYGDAFHTFQDLDSVIYLAVNGTVTSLPVFIQNILNCVPKTNEAFTGSEGHGGKWLMTKKIILGWRNPLIWLAISMHAKVLRDPLVQYSRGLNWHRYNMSMWIDMACCFGKGRGSTETPSKLFANHNALGQLTNHNTFRFSEGGFHQTRN